MRGRRLIPALLIALAMGQSALAVIPFPRVDPTDPSSKPYRISSAFGPRMTSKTGFDIHEAIDFAGPPDANDPVYALEGSIVKHIDFLQAKKTDRYPYIVYLQIEGAHKLGLSHCRWHS